MLTEQGINHFITIKNREAEIARLAEETTNFCKQNNISEAIQFKILLAIEELIVNIITYAYFNSDEHEINITLNISNNKFTGLIVDDGKQFNPLMLKEANTSLPLSERQIGGLGIHLVRKTMDEVYYYYENGKNHFKFIKYIN